MEASNAFLDFMPKVARLTPFVILLLSFLLPLYFITLGAAQIENQILLRMRRAWGNPTAHTVISLDYMLWMTSTAIWSLMCFAFPCTEMENGESEPRNERCLWNTSVNILAVEAGILLVTLACWAVEAVVLLWFPVAGDIEEGIWEDEGKVDVVVEGKEVN